jgi:hypothetical protein
LCNNFSSVNIITPFLFSNPNPQKENEENKKSPLDDAKEEYTGGGGSGRTTQVSDYFLYNHLHHPLF